MHTWLTAGLWTLWAAWLAQAVLSVLLVRKFFRRRVRQGIIDSPPHTPRAWVVVPFKGVEPGLAEGARALCRLDYPDYRLICVVASEDDPAVPVLRAALAAHPDRPGELLVAGQAPDDEGQKVHNLRCAIRRLEPDSAEGDAWVFADSDAVVGPAWLRRLVWPLQFPDRGVTTGYRWLVPQGPRPGLWSHLASLINSSAASFLIREKHYQAWGGSMALLARTARRGDLLGRLAGTLSDDYTVTRMIRELGLKIWFVPQCLVPSPVRLGARAFFNFARRQYLISRVYAPRLYLAALWLTGLYTAGAVSAAAGLAAAVGWGWAPGWAAGGAILGVAAADSLRSGYRRRIVRYAFGPDTERRMRTTLWLDRWATPLWMAVHLGVILSAAAGRVMSWRGIRYRLDGPNAVRRLDG